MISSALTHGERAKSFQQKKVTDLIDMMYKKSLIDTSQTNAETGSMNAATSRLNALSKDNRTTMQKNYTTAISQGYKGSMLEFASEALTSHEKEYERAKDEGYEGNFNAYLKEMTSLGGTTINIGEQVAKAGALADVKAEKYFTDPKGGLTADVDKHINTEEVQNKLFTLEPSNRGLALSKEKEAFIIGKIKSAGGKIIESKLEGRDYVFIVEWPSGKTSEVRYGN